MIQKLKQSVMFAAMALVICLMFPCTAKAATTITGGDSLKNAVEI